MSQDCAPLSSSVATTPSRRIAILSYHQTATPPARGVPVRSLVLPPWRFALQLHTLKALGWRGLSMRDLEPYLRGEREGKVFGITLDDGYLNNHRARAADPAPAGVHRDRLHRDGADRRHQRLGPFQGRPPTALMGLDELRSWLDAGMELGAHTRTHVDVTTCSDATARDEIIGSKRDLEDALGIEVRTFCYPYGAHRAEHADIVRQAGFQTATTIVSTRVRPGDDPMRLPRISIHLQDSLPRMMAQVTTD